MLAALPPPIVDVRPAIEIRTASPVNEVAVDGGRAATLVGETPSWEYVLVWSPKGIVVRPSLACDRQESDLVLAGDRFAHVCFEGDANTVLTATFRRTSAAFRGCTRRPSSCSPGTARSSPARPGRRSGASTREQGEGAHVPRAGHRARRRRRPDPRRPEQHRPRSRVADRQDASTLKLPHLGGALLRGTHIASIANHRFVLSDLHGKALRTRPVVGDATLVDFDGGLVVYSVGIRLHLLRLGDGRDVTLRFKGQFGYASAKLSHGGFFYTYNVRGGSKPGRAGFVSAAAVRTLLRR